MYFSSNIKLLRKRRGCTQNDLASSLNMKQSTLSDYENNVAQPGLQALIAFSEYLNISIDTLIRVNMTELSEHELSQVERGYDVDISGSNLKKPTSNVSDENKDNIELVNEKAKAGHKSGFVDPEYIKILPTFQLPFLQKEREYKTFQIEGDSMLPIPDKAFVTGEYVQNWNMIQDRRAYIIVTMNNEVVFKIAENQLKEKGILRVHSLNELYEPYDIKAKDIREVWKFVRYISSEVPDSNKKNVVLNKKIENNLEKKVKAIQTKLNFDI